MERKRKYKNYDFSEREYDDLTEKEKLQYEFIELFVKHRGHSTAVCEELNLPNRTYNQWKKKDPNFRFNLKIAQKIMDSFCEDVAIPMYHKLISQGNWKALERYLNARNIDMPVKEEIKDTEVKLKFELCELKEN